MQFLKHLKQQKKNITNVTDYYYETIMYMFETAFTGKVKHVFPF